jgi:hypothetical protein
MVQDDNEFDPVQFLNHNENYSLSFQNCDINSENCTYISITYPVFDVEENAEMTKIREAIELLLFGDDSASVEEIGRRFIENYDDFVNDESINEDGYDLAWYDIRDGEIIFINKRALSFAASVASFYGGAHPSEYVYLRNFDPLSGDSIGLGMVFKEEALKELTSIGEREFRKRKGLKKKDSLEENGYWFEEDRFELTSNFAFTENGLWFYYNDYEIAPYSMGSSEIILPYNQIAHLFE